MTARKRAQRIRDHFAYESASEDEAHFQLAEREILAAEREAVEAFCRFVAGNEEYDWLDEQRKAWLRSRGEG